MKKPTIIECFADNGEHSHWSLVDSENGNILWDEFEEELSTESKKVAKTNLQQLKQFIAQSNELIYNIELHAGL